MSLQLKSNCQKILFKMQTRLQQILKNFKNKKVFHIQKIVQYLNNDLQFLTQQLRIMWDQLFYLEQKNQQKDQLIFNYEQKIEEKEKQKNKVQEIMKYKCNKLSKQLNFLHFSNKNIKQSHQKCLKIPQKSKSDYLQSKLDQLKQQVIQTNKRVCFKVAEIKSQIKNQNKQQTSQEDQCLKDQLKQNIQLQISDIYVDKVQSPIKINKQINLADTPSTKTFKKEKSRQNYVQQKEKNKTCTKKQQLAALIYHQCKTQANKQHYLSTNL